MTIHFADIAWTAQPHYWLANARIPICLLADPTVLGDPDEEGVARADLLIADGKIARVAPTGAATRNP